LRQGATWPARRFTPFFEEITIDVARRVRSTVMNARLSLLTALLCSAALPAQAQAVDPRILALEAQVEALRAQLEELKRESAARAVAPPPAVVPAPIAAPASRPAPEGVVATIGNGRPVFTSNDGRFSLAIRGFFQYDLANYQQDPAGLLATDFRRGGVGAGDNAPARDLANGGNFRRARLGVEGKAFSDWQYNITLDFGGSGTEDTELNAAWLQYDGLGPVKLRIGAFPPNMGLEEAASSSGLLLAERPAVSEMLRSLVGGDGRNSAAIFGNGERWYASAAVTGAIAAAPATLDEQVGYAGRLAFAPVKTAKTTVHLGANLAAVAEPPQTGVPATAYNVRLRERPEARVDGTRLIDTGDMNLDNLLALGGEVAVQHGPLSLQGEYFDIQAQRRLSALPDPNFSGWYVEGAWTLTGEPRRYNMAGATFELPRPAKPFDRKTGGLGAWEMVARYSVLDLNFNEGAEGSTLPIGGIRGGEQAISTLGLNWYPNASIRFQAAFQDVSVDRLSPGGTYFGADANETPAAGVQVGQDFQIWSLRSQYSF